MGRRYKIFFINLDKSVGRRAAMEKQLARAGLPFERFSAVDGNAQAADFFDKHYSASENAKMYFAPLTKSEIACYVSHLKVCEKILAENLDYAVVLEDDVILSDSFRFVPQILESIENWNYIKLIAPFKKRKILSTNPVAFEIHATCNVNLLRTAKSQNDKTAPISFELVQWRKPPAGTQAYAITKDGAKEFLAKRSRFFRPIDVDLQYTWETKLDVRGLLPSLCEIADIPSEISHKKRSHYSFARLVCRAKYYLSSKYHAK